VRQRGERFMENEEDALQHGRLPDPIMQALDELSRRVEVLEQALQERQGSRGETREDEGGGSGA
jgi:hypothetical protein